MKSAGGVGALASATAPPWPAERAAISKSFLNQRNSVSFQRYIRFLAKKIESAKSTRGRVQMRFPEHARKSHTASTTRQRSLFQKWTPFLRRRAPGSRRDERARRSASISRITRASGSGGIVSKAGYISVSDDVWHRMELSFWKRA